MINSPRWPAVITRSPLFLASITRGHLSFSTSHDTSKHGHTTSPNMTPVSISNVSTNITVSPTTLLRTRGHMISSTTCPSPILKEHTIRRGLTLRLHRCFRDIHPDQRTKIIKPLRVLRRVSGMKSIIHLL